MKANRSLWLLAAGAIAGTSFAMAVDQIEPQASAQQASQLAAAAAPPETPRRVPASNTELMLSYAPLVKATAPAVVNVYTAHTCRHSILRSRTIPGSAASLAPPSDSRRSAS